ncbi:MAG: TIGR00730 family Rossman fold protein [Planctomycetes bacterium]|nr:TIGR00730 family Rossman fold protein [Planctomycetota bacterium]
MPLSICVYSSSSDHLDPVYYETARELARQMASRGHTLVYGGGNNGLMGAMATEMQRTGGGRIVGVIPVALRDAGYGLETVDEQIVTDGMRDRKAVMEERADAFIALPGGFGTFEELLEVVTLKQLRYHAKPIVIFDVASYYDPLLEQFERMFERRFAKRKFAQLYHVSRKAAEALDYLENYRPDPDAKRGIDKYGSDA